ncbi:MAG TPA: hypothetical protein VKZ18_22085 [Polyangia bacterium]|nr:hypothetical protein [Polyangia bacterium]
MGFSIGSLVSDITSVASDPGRLVGDIANSILPGNMKAIGDTLGGLVDLETGHPLQALGHLADSLKDLPQLLAGQAGAQAKAAATPAGTAAAEPSPPPSRPSTGPAGSAPAGVGTSFSPAAAVAPANAPTVTVRQVAGETVTRIDDGKTSTIVDQKGGQTTVTIKSDAALAPAASAPAPAPAGMHPAPAPSAAGTATTTVTVAAATTAATTAKGTGPSSATSSPATSAGTDAGASSSSAAAPKDLASLMALGPDQFMQAVTSGKIPPDVANNQTAMMEVQARMNQITQMNQLVTSMMAAMHQMQMSIIQNIRV